MKIISEIKYKFFINCDTAKINTSFGKTVKKKKSELRKRAAGNE